MAVLVATDLFGLALALLVGILLPNLVLRALVYCISRLQLTAAGRFAPFLFSRGMTWVLSLFCGRKYSAWALNNYAVKLFEAEQFSASITVCTRAIRLKDDCADYWALRGASRYSNGEFRYAIEDLTKAIDLDTAHQIGRTYRGYTYFANEDFNKALCDFERVECNSSAHYMTAYLRGSLYEVLNQWTSAMEDYLLANSLDASKTDAGIALARLQAGCPDDNVRDGENAVQNATLMCVRTNWNDWIAISVLGAAYSETCDFDNAIKYAKLAFDMAPKHEKPERANRVAQFRNHEPYRIPSFDVAVGREGTKNES